MGPQKAFKQTVVKGGENALKMVAILGHEPMVLFPNLMCVHAQVYQIGLRAQEHAGDLRCDHDPHGCLLP